MDSCIACLVLDAAKFTMRLMMKVLWSGRNCSSATCEEGCDIIQICGLTNKDGLSSYFESDAYHLARFCEDEGLKLKKIEDVHDFDTLWNQ